MKNQTFLISVPIFIQVDDLNQKLKIMLELRKQKPRGKEEYRSMDITKIGIIRNVLTRRRECGTYLATARRHRRRIKMQKRDE